MSRSLRRRSRLASLMLAVACALTLVGAGRAAAAVSSPLALGVNVDNAPGDVAPLQDYASLAGRRPSIVMWYQQWSEPLSYSTQLPNVAAQGAVPMITWDPTLNGVGIPFSQIASGRYDTYIKTAASAATAWGRPILIRFAHEMNLPDSPFSASQPGDGPSNFVAAWRHVVSVFRQEGASNVEWVWSPNVDCSGSCPFTAYYPGDAWVDWVALDGYNAGALDQVPWQSFAQVFGSSYATLHRLTSKPMMIAETASTGHGGDKAAWINQTFRTLPSAYPQIRAVVWFDRDKETDWRVNSSPAVLQAWRAVVASPTYAGTASTVMSAAPLVHDVTSLRATIAVSRKAAPHRKPTETRHKARRKAASSRRAAARGRRAANAHGMLTRVV